jgi:hypothetical protein
MVSRSILRQLQQPHVAREEGDARESQDVGDSCEAWRPRSDGRTRYSLPPIAALMTSLLCCVYLSAGQSTERWHRGHGAFLSPYRVRAGAGQRSRFTGRVATVVDGRASERRPTLRTAAAAATVAAGSGGSIRQRAGDSPGGGCLRRERTNSRRRLNQR